MMPMLHRPGHETHQDHGDGTNPLDDLRHEHVLILRALRVAEAFADRVDAGTALDRALLARLIAFLQTFADRCHHGKEEQHLFPALARSGVPTDSGPVAVLLAEHTDGRGLIGAMAARDDRQVARAMRGYVALLRAHIDKENGILFPLAEEALGEDTRRELAAAFDAVEAAVVGPGEHDRLVDELTRLEAAVGGT